MSLPLQKRLFIFHNFNIINLAIINPEIYNGYIFTS